MKSFSYKPIFVPKYIFQSFFSFFFIRILFLLMLQSLISQEYVTQSFKTSAYDSSYNILLQIIEDKKGFLWYTTHNGLVHELGTQTFFYSLKTHPDEVVDIKNFISEALESKDPQKIEFINAIKEVRFKEHEWDFNVSPHCGSVQQKVIEIIHKKMRKSAYYEDPDLTEINDNTFGGMC